MRYLFCVFVFYASLLPGALAQEPPKQDSQGTQNNADNKRGTEQSPFIIKIIPTDSGNDKADANTTILKIMGHMLGFLTSRPPTKSQPSQLLWGLFNLLL
jgi:hypothetical protein